MQYPSPNQPLPVKAINRVGAFASRLGVGSSPLTAGKLMAAATKRARLNDFGDESFLEGLEVLLEALNGEAQLSTIGRLACKETITANLAKRLALVEYRKQRPEVAEQKIERPLIVMGLPRTGTTILYELLAQDPNHRWPISWEVEEPVPPAQRETFFTDSRVEVVDKTMAQIEELAPGFRAIHAIGATLPQECIAMTASDFRSDQYGVMYFIPSYDQWLRRADLAPTYRYHRHFLQHLQVDFAKPRWVLKSPAHLPYIKTIIDEYPDCCIVQTHRDPMKVIASLSSLACSLHSAFSDHVDPVTTAAHEVDHFSWYLNEGLRQRSAIEAAEGSGRFFDVQFEDILQRPMDAIADMYAHFGFEWNDEIRGAMQRYLDNRPRDKHGTHKYTLDEFGLSQEQHGPLFDDYLSRFSVRSAQ